MLELLDLFMGPLQINEDVFEKDYISASIWSFCKLVFKVNLIFLCCHGMVKI